jgi:hypothetical protein
MTVVVRNGLRWVAGDDGIGHARPRFGKVRTLCGARPFDERYAWPVATYCATCTERTEDPTS